jgi:hypothetical protein
MQTISEAMQTMITSGRYLNPSARLVCDIDPPFVGVDTLMESASGPFFYEYENTLYMSVVKSTGIVIYSVDIATKGLTQVASITAANVQNARFCYDGTTFYAIWENSVDGKIYYYNGTTTTELATGICPDILYNSAVYLLWIGADAVYQKTGTTVSKLVEQETGETLKGLRVFLMPDGVIMPCYVVETAEQDEVRVLTSEIEEKVKYIDELVDGVDISSRTISVPSPSYICYNQWPDSSDFMINGVKYTRGLGMYGVPHYSYPEIFLYGNLRGFKRITVFCGKDSAKGGGDAYFKIGVRYGGDILSKVLSTPEYISGSLSAWLPQLGTHYSALRLKSIYDPHTIYSVWANLLLIYDARVAKTIHTADKGTLDRLQGSFSGNNIYLSWYQNGVVYGRALYESEMFTEYNSTQSYIPEMTGNTMGFFVASAKAEAGTMVQAYKAFDGDKTSLPYWFDSTALPTWVRIGLDKSVSLASYSITPTANTSNWSFHSAPIDFELQGSYDGVSWETVDSKTGLNYASPDQWWSGVERVFVLPTTPKLYPYFRLYITRMGGRYRDYGEGVMGDGQCVFGELKLYVSKTYNGSSNLGRWTGSTQFCSGFGNYLPVTHVTNSEIDLVVWERDGNLVYAPKVLGNPISADCTLSRSMESGSFNADFANNGEFVTGDLAELFENEKKIGFEIGYDGEFIRKATGQADSDTVKRTESNIITISAKNKFYDLMQTTITRNYDKRYSIGTKTTVLTEYALTGSIAANGVVEVRIDSTNGKRWIPGSMEISNLTAGFTAITPVYGQTEFFGFVRIRNDSGTSGTPSFDVLAEDCTSLARKVGERGSVLNESKTLTGTTAIRLTHKNIDGTLITKKENSVVVKNSSTNKEYDYTDKPEESDYVLAVDGDGYTTIARTANSAITDGEAVKIDYNYITRTTFSMSFSGSATSQDILTFLQLSAPESYQVKILSVSEDHGFDSWWPVSIDEYYATHRPLHIFAEASVNGVLLQFVLQRVNRDLAIEYEVWARPMENEQAFGIYPVPEDIFKDLARRALYKDVKFAEYNGTLEDGKFTSYDKYDLFFSIEEGFDPNTLRIENISTKGDAGAISHDVNISIVEAGYIIDNDGYQNWGVRLSVTRAAYSGASLDYSFQIWGQYTARKDFLPPFNLSVSDLPQTNLTKPLRVVDITIEEAARKALQVCFADGRPFDMFIGGRGEWVIKLIKSEAFNDAAHIFQARNMGSITQKRQSPLVLDRVEIEGATTESYLIQDKPEKIDTVSAYLPANFDLNGHTVSFKKTYDPDSLYFVYTERWKCNVYLVERTSSYCKFDFLNTADDDWFGKSWGKATIEVWGTPISSVNYQQLYTAKTNPGAGGKYRLNTAEVKNDLITDPITAGQVADQIIIESCQDALKYTPGTCPANPALEPMDTCIISFSELGSEFKALVEEITFNFDMDDNKPVLSMDVELIPRKPWAAGFVSKYLTFDGNQKIQDIIIQVKDKATDFLNLLFG